MSAVRSCGLLGTVSFRDTTVNFPWQDSSSSVYIYFIIYLFHVFWKPNINIEISIISKEMDNKVDTVLF